MPAPDLTLQFNTPLKPAQEDNFRAWLEDQSGKMGRNMALDLADYDLRGWWLKNEGADVTGGHFTDRYKKPSHPTFSTESKYSTDEIKGGEWKKDDGGKWTFTAGPTNLQFHKPEELQQYFKQGDPDSTLVLPGAGQ